jgi:hypothetical protein
MSESLHVEVRLTLRPEGMAATVAPGRQAMADTLRDLLMPNGLEYVHLEIEGHKYVITAIQRLHVPAQG